MTAYSNINIYGSAACPAEASAAKKAAGIAGCLRALRPALARRAAQFRSAHPVLAAAVCVAGVPAGILGSVFAVTALVISPLALVFGW